MTTRDEAVDRAATVIAAALDLRDSMTPREAAEAAWTPTGPSVDELERRIRSRRGYAREQPGGQARKARAA